MPVHAFTDPVFDAQTVFRAAMNALARPGEIVPLAPGTLPPEPLTPVLAALALALCDHETPIWLDPQIENVPEAVDFLRFHTGASIAPHPAAAAFALISNPAAMPGLAAFAQGTPDYPDRSATLLIAVDDLGADGPFTLAGPGIAGERRFGAMPLPEGFAAEWAENHARFPLGVDALLAAPGRLAGLPRTVALREG